MPFRYEACKGQYLQENSADIPEVGNHPIMYVFLRN